MKKLLVGTLLAGTAMFLWGGISWMALPWHNPKSFKDEGAVIAAIRSAAPESGVYMVPGMVHADGSMRPEAAWTKAAQDGPFMIGMVRPGANPRSMASYMITGYLTHLVMAGVLGLILMRVPLGYPCLVKLSGMIGLLITLVTWLPLANWYEYPFQHWGPYLVDNVGMCLVAGAILGRFVIQPGARCR